MHDVRPELDTLAQLFYPTTLDLGEFAEVPVGQLPETYRRLLAHTSHMTVTVEAYFGSAVDVRVVRCHQGESHYSREILLCRRDNGRVVQHGIVRINWAHVSREVRDEIESQRTPLGRVLIQHGVLRSVQLYNLWRVMPGAHLTELFELPEPRETYGRTALIEFAGEPAIELIEIIAPLPLL